jgi:hypothetical protein
VKWLKEFKEVRGRLTRNHVVIEKAMDWNWIVTYKKKKKKKRAMDS